MCIAERDYRAACMVSKACDFAGSAARTRAIWVAITSGVRVACDRSEAPIRSGSDQSDRERDTRAAQRQFRTHLQEVRPSPVVAVVASSALVRIRSVYGALSSRR